MTSSNETTYVAFGCREALRSGRSQGIFKAFRQAPDLPFTLFTKAFPIRTAGFLRISRRVDGVGFDMGGSGGMTCGSRRRYRGRACRLPCGRMGRKRFAPRHNHGHIASLPQASGFYGLSGPFIFPAFRLEQGKDTFGAIGGPSRKLLMPVQPSDPEKLRAAVATYFAFSRCTASSAWSRWRRLMLAPRVAIRAAMTAASSV
jgi:hypothetical protein